MSRPRAAASAPSWRCKRRSSARRHTRRPGTVTTSALQPRAPSSHRPGTPALVNSLPSVPLPHQVPVRLSDPPAAAAAARGDGGSQARARPPARVRPSLRRPCAAPRRPPSRRRRSSRACLARDLGRMRPRRAALSSTPPPPPSHRPPPPPQSWAWWRCGCSLPTPRRERRRWRAPPARSRLISPRLARSRPISPRLARSRPVSSDLV